MFTMTPYFEFDSTTKHYYFISIRMKNDIPDSTIVEEDILLTFSDKEEDVIRVRNKLIKEGVCKLNNLKIVKYDNILYNGEK